MSLRLGRGGHVQEAGGAAWDPGVRMREGLTLYHFSQSPGNPTRLRTPAVGSLANIANGKKKKKKKKKDPICQIASVLESQ